MMEMTIANSQKHSLEITIRKILTHNDHINNSGFHAFPVNEDNQNDNEEQHLSETTTKTPHSIARKRLPMTVIFVDSIVKDKKGWK